MNQRRPEPHKDADDTLSAWLPSLLWMALLFYLSSLPQLPGPEEILTIQIIRKTGHAGVFAILFTLNARALQKTRPAAPRLTRWAWTLTVLYAGFDELHQGFVPGRTAALTDVLIDALGATVAAFLWSRWAVESDPAEPATR